MSQIFDLDSSVEQIKNDETFLKLKEVIENNRGHDHEAVYDHSIATCDRMKKLLDGNIANPNANRELKMFLNQTVSDVSKKELLVLASLLHDIGKLKSFQTNPDGTTASPEHGYLGSLMIPDLLKNLRLADEAVDYLSTIVKLHIGILPNYPSTAGELASYLKKNIQGLHVEVTLVMYADVFNHPDFQEEKIKVIEILNRSDFYQS